MIDLAAPPHTSQEIEYQRVYVRSLEGEWELALYQWGQLVIDTHIYDPEPINTRMGSLTPTSSLAGLVVRPDKRLERWLGRLPLEDAPTLLIAYTRPERVPSRWTFSVRWIEWGGLKGQTFEHDMGGGRHHAIWEREEHLPARLELP